MTMTRTRTRLARRTAVAAPLAIAALVLSACAPQDDSASGGSASGASGCGKDALTLQTKGTFTVATDDPAYEPWFSDNKPANGKGYESAVAYAVADQLGFAKGDVVWVKAAFNSVIAPGPKTFDVDVNQVSITDERKQAVDFSSGYYDVAQAFVTVKGSALDGKTKVTDLAGAKLGAQVGTTSYTAIKDQIKPSADPAVFDTNDLAIQSLQNGQIDGIVVDLPTAFYIVAAQLDNGVIVGQLPASGTPDQFGMVLDKGSALTPCVSKAVDALRADGTLADLQKKWLTSAGAPELS